MASIEELVEASEAGTYGVDSWRELVDHGDCRIDGEMTPFGVDYFDEDGDLADTSEATHAALACFAHDEAEYIALFGGPG